MVKVHPHHYVNLCLGSSVPYIDFPMDQTKTKEKSLGNFRTREVASNGSNDFLSTSGAISDGFVTSYEGFKLATEQDDQRGQSLRKCRRGAIEKRRRDRINCSLSELKRLIPAAFEKQGSQKLEKAEILQMAIQLLGSFGANDRNTMEQWTNTDEFYSMGFRFCSSEADQFLSNEGLDLQHHLRIRLSNHLQCFGTQCFHGR